VTIDVLASELSAESPFQNEAIERATSWFHRLEVCCSRFEPQSELMQLCSTPGRSLKVSPLLFEVVRFALSVAQESEGAFDPTIGRAMENRGFDRNFRSGDVVHHADDCLSEDVSYRDVLLDEANCTITLARPLILDLGGVAKGLAVDMAARELSSFPDFAINAGGDLYLSGQNAEGLAWNVGIRHPRHPDALIECLRLSNTAVCTSGDYERQGVQGHHILNPQTGESAGSVASVTVIAPTTMLADALSTAAFVLGPRDGIALLEQLGVHGLIFTPSMQRYASSGLPEVIAHV